MTYFNFIRAFALAFVFVLTNVPVQAEPMYTRLECKVMDGSSHYSIQSMIFLFDDGKPAFDITQTSDPQEMADLIWDNLNNHSFSDAVTTIHAEPFRETLFDEHGLQCNDDVVVAKPSKTIESLKRTLNLADSVTVKFLKKFDNIDLEIRVIPYPEE